MREALLIDLSSLYWSSWHATRDAPVSEAAALSQMAINRAVSVVHEPFSDGEPPLIAICIDKGRSFRKDLAADYKANRPEKDQSALAELDKLREKLERDGYWLVGADGFEADDVIATLAHQASAAGHPVAIASSDKDLLQLLALPDSRQIRTHNDWSVWRAANVVEKFGVEPEGLGDWLALVGDTSDGIKGCESVGPKRATELLIKHGGLDILMARIGDLQPVGDSVESKTPKAKEIATPAVVEALFRCREQIALARKLVTLRTDAPVKFDDIFKERRQIVSEKAKNGDLDNVDDLIVGPSVPSTAGSVSAPSATTEPASTVSVEPAKTTATVPQAPSPATETALVPVEVEYQHALEPRSGAGARAMAEYLYESRAYSRFPTAGAIYATICRGRELGVPALASLDAFHFVAELGRVLPSWQVLVTLAEQAPDCEYFRWVGGDKKSQTWETKHRKHSEPTRLTYTIQQAERAGLIKTDKPKSAWMARPDEMLRKTAACQLARAVYSGATLGLYSAEEMGSES